MDKTETQPVQEDPITILQLQYIKGEISKEEYEEMKRVRAKRIVARAIEEKEGQKS